MSYTILQNLNYAAPYPGNLMRSVFNLQTKLKEKGIDTVFLFPENARGIYWIQDMIQAGERVYFKSNSFGSTYRIFKHIVKKHNIRLIHTHFWNINDMLSIKLVKILNRKIKSIVHHHNHYSSSKSKVNEKLKRMLLNCDVHIACSDDIAEKLREQGFGNVHSVENAIDFSRLDGFDDVKKEDRSFLLFGFDYMRKGVDIVLDAFEKLNNKEAILKIVFAANEEDGLNKIKKKFGTIPKWIKVLPPTDDIAKYYRSSLAFISASREEGLCYSIIEAAYCDCQSIISDIPGHSTDVPEVKIFKSESADELKAKIALVLEETESERARISSIQKSYCIKKYDLEKWSSDIADIYFEILND